MDLKETEILGNTIDKHWYYRSKAAAMLRLLRDCEPNTILDVGAGSGFFSRHLLTHTDAHEAWCVDISYQSESDAAEAGKAIHYRRSIDKLPADVVLLMDVLQHVDSDSGLLADYAARVPAGAQFLISVPAFQFMWSAHDEFLEHKRRYTLSGLADMVERSGLRVSRRAYYFGLVFPIAMAMRLATRRLGAGMQPAQSQLKKHSPITNGFLTAVCMAELPLLAVNHLAGLTAFCLAERP